MITLTHLAGDAQKFVQHIWASQVHLHRSDPSDLMGLLSLDDVDALLTSTAIRTPAVRLARDGVVLPTTRYTRHCTIAGQPLTGLIDPQAVLREFDAGATIVLQGLHRYHAPLAELVAELELALGHPCQANAYLTPPHSQGFAVHSDTHDVFVIQTAGSKHWQIHSAESVPPDEQHHWTVTLEPGLVLYLPTGTPHAANAQESASLHVTIGINQLTWRQALHQALDAVLPNLPWPTAAGPDGHLPAGYLDDPQRFTELLCTWSQLAGAALAESDPQPVVAAQRTSFLTGRGPRLRGALTDRITPEGHAVLPHLTDTIWLQRRSGRPFVLADPHSSTTTPEMVSVLLGDRALQTPAWTQPALEQIARIEGPWQPIDLSTHLDPTSRLVLCRRLIREGALELAPANSPGA